MSDALYRELILDLYQHPSHRGEFPECTHAGVATNSSCGDSGILRLKIRNGLIEKVLWQGSGCAISCASMEVVADFLEGKQFSEIHHVNKADVLHRLGLEEISPGREKCLFLSLRALSNLKEISHSK